jgi:hypothetical protein
MLALGSQHQIPQKTTMKRAESNITEQQLGLLKAVPLLNGKRGALRYGSMANVGLSYYALIHYYLLPVNLPFIAGSGKSILWCVISYNASGCSRLTR